MAGKQVKFPEKQTHNKQFEMALLAFCAICIVFVIIMVNVVAGGEIVVE